MNHIKRLNVLTMSELRAVPAQRAASLYATVSSAKEFNLQRRGH